MFPMRSGTPGGVGRSNVVVRQRPSCQMSTTPGGASGASAIRAAQKSAVAHDTDSTRASSFGVSLTTGNASAVQTPPDSVSTSGRVPNSPPARQLPLDRQSTLLRTANEPPGSGD